MKHYVFRCYKCKRWQSGQTNKIQTYSFKCNKCGRSKKVWSSKIGPTVEKYGPIEPTLVAKHVQELNKQEVLIDGATKKNALYMGNCNGFQNAKEM